MDIKLRQRMEKLLAYKTAKELIKAGYWLMVDNGDELLPNRPQNNVHNILREMFSVDHEHLIVYVHETVNDVHDFRRVGWVFFTYGETGWDTICDYTANLEPQMELLNTTIDRLCDIAFRSN